MKKFTLALAAATMLTAGAASAEDKKWFAKVGASYVMPDSYGVLAGTNVIKADNAFTGSVEFGRFVTDRISVSLAGGIPPTHTILRNGVSTGTTDTLGALALLGQFHLLNDSKFDAYVGGGLAYNIYFSTTNPAITGIDNGFAPVLQAGFEFKANETVGIFFDVKKEFYTTKINYNPAAFSFQERLDPLVLTTGMSLHF